MASVLMRYCYLLVLLQLALGHGGRWVPLARLLACFVAFTIAG